MRKLKTIFFGIIIALIIAFFNMKNTTSTGEVGADRKQMMLISSEAVEESAKKAYAQVLSEAKAQGILNKNEATTKRVKKNRKSTYCSNRCI